MNSSGETKLQNVDVQGTAVQLALRRAIDDVLDDLIIAGADKVALLRDNRRKNKLALSRSQIRNVVNEATGKRSREAITNFIRYQMGRKEGDAWRYIPSDVLNRKAFGREIIADIEGEGDELGLIDAAANRVCEKVNAELLCRNFATDASELKREAQAQLIALYLGYLNRTYAYCEEMDDKAEGKVCWDDIKRIAKRKGGAA